MRSLLEDSDRTGHSMEVFWSKSCRSSFLPKQFWYETSLEKGLVESLLAFEVPFGRAWLESNINDFLSETCLVVELPSGALLLSRRPNSRLSEHRLKKDETDFPMECTE